MAEKNSQSVPIRTNTQEKYHTHVPDFLAGEFLPMQLIYLYRGKTKSSLPGISAKGFWIYLTQDLKHYFNTTPCKEEKTLRMTDSIINPYLVQTRRHLKLPPTQQAILIWPDVFFRGQKTEIVLSKLASRIRPYKHDSCFSTYLHPHYIESEAKFIRISRQHLKHNYSSVKNIWI